MGVLPSCSHMEMSLWCHIRQGKIFPSPRMLHQCWNRPTAAAFGRYDAEMRLENTGSQCSFCKFCYGPTSWVTCLYVGMYGCSEVGQNVPCSCHPVTPWCCGSHLWAASAGAPRHRLSSQESDSKAHVWIFKQKALTNLPGKCNKNVFLKKICYQNDR